MNQKSRFSVLSGIIAIGLFVWTPMADSAEFYKGKTLFLLVGSAPGGGFDTYARVLARNLPRFIPGEPTIVVKNRGGGAGNLLTANAVYNTEAKDGTVIGTFAEGLILEQVMGRKGIDFDAGKLQWLGAMTKGTKACIVRTDTGVKNLADTMKGRQLFIGTSGPGEDLHTVPAIIAKLGANWKLIPGYGGSSKLLLALEGKEIDGFCATFLAVLRRAKQLLKGEEPAAKFIVVTGSKTPENPLLKEVPTWYVLAKTENDKELLELNDGGREISKPYAVAPEVPKDRVRILRKALAAAVTDPKVIAEIKKTGLDLQFTSAGGTKKVVDELMKTPQPSVDRLKVVLGLKAG